MKPPVQAVLLPRRHCQPLRSRDPGSINEGGELGLLWPTPLARRWTTPTLIAAVRSG
ncbi:MAG: hypothetical protein ACLRWQ_19535 [Flavonifractor plautii]